MARESGHIEMHASQEAVEVRGRLTRTEWELVYLAIRKLALADGLSIERFDLESAELDGPRREGADLAPPLAARPAACD
jgi:hypothetical protein